MFLVFNIYIYELLTDRWPLVNVEICHHTDANILKYKYDHKAFILSALYKINHILIGQIPLAIEKTNIVVFEALLIVT